MSIEIETDALARRIQIHEQTRQNPEQRPVAKDALAVLSRTCPPRKPSRPRDDGMQRQLPLRTWTPLGQNLYRHANGQYYERITLEGRRTFRALGTDNDRLARQKIAANQIAQARSQTGACASPYERQVFITTGQVIEKYLADGCPDRQRQPRPKLTRAAEMRNCQTLKDFWQNIPVDQVTLAAMDRYCDHRTRQVQSRESPHHGFRTVDLELCTLNNAFVWGVRCEVVRYNPMSERRPKYSSEKNIKHCREYMPADADQLHDIARKLFADPRSEPLGWQYLLEAFTGLRTAEALQLRTDAAPGTPGYIYRRSPTTSEAAVPSSGSLNIGRAKNGINPFVIMTPHLEQLLNALFRWKSARYPNSPWYLPSPRKFGQNQLDKSALAHALIRVSESIGRKLTSHGARAYYVTARRSWGISDIQIAIEIGHRGGPGLLTTTYGGVPTNWLTGDGPKMTWLPSTGEPAWSVLNLGERPKILRLPQQKAA